MKSNLISFVVGLVFAIGLVLSGMTNPKKVQGFLDILGDFDPTLIFVILGAVVFNLISFRFITKRQPICASEHSLPSKQQIDKKLIFGAILFGIGWGLMGICPGPAIVNLVTLKSNAILFVVSMLVGMFIFTKIESKIT